MDLMYSVLVFFLRYGLAHYRRKKPTPASRQAALDAAVSRFPTDIFRHPLKKLPHRNGKPGDRGIRSCRHFTCNYLKLLKQSFCELKK